MSLFAGQARAQTCFDVFGDSAPLHAIQRALHQEFSKQPDRVFSVLVRDEIGRTVGTYESSAVENGRVMVTFREGRPKPNSRLPRDRFIKVSTDDAVVGIDQESPQEDSVALLKSSARLFNVVTRDLAQAMYEPGRALYSSPRIKVFGGSAKKAAFVGETIAHFDSMMSDLGFTIPSQTHIFITETSLGPNKQIGPYCFALPTWSPWRGMADDLIRLSPYGESTKIVTNLSVITHERVHSILKIHYSNAAFINLESAVALQEALADFITSHAHNNPRMGEGAELPIRDISGGSDDPTAPLPLVRGKFSPKNMEEHVLSMAYSGVLWKLRTALGAERMSRDLKPIIDALASTSGPYTAFITYSPFEIESANLKHFLSVLAHYYENDPEALAVVNSAATANLFSLPALLDYNKPLSTDHGPLLQKGVQKPFPKTLLAASTARFAAKPGIIAAIAYVVLNALSDDDDKK